MDPAEIKKIQEAVKVRADIERMMLGSIYEDARGHASSAGIEIVLSQQRVLGNALLLMLDQLDEIEKYSRPKPPPTDEEVERFLKFCDDIYDQDCANRPEHDLVLLSRHLTRIWCRMIKFFAERT